MIITRLMGGLGNQLFQYALGRQLSILNNTEFKIDLSFLLRSDHPPTYVPRDYSLDIFMINIPFATENDLKISLLKKIFSRQYKIVNETHFHFDPHVKNLRGNLLLSGYWQSEKYFLDIQDVIKNDFIFKNDLSPKAKELALKIESRESICINVRRTDFVNHYLHDVCDIEYYKRSIQYISNRIKNPYYFIFSDDIEWCQKYLKPADPFMIVDHTYAGYKFQEKFRLMSLCKHFIIPNSTFAWWAVWFNKNRNKIVIAPEMWFKDSSIITTDLVPSDWVRL